MDWTRSMVTPFSWAIVEMWCGIICANLPNLRGFIRRYFPSISGRDAEAKSPVLSDLECNRAVPPDAHVDHLDSSDLSSSTSDHIIPESVGNDRLNEPYQSTSTVVSSALFVPSSDKSI
jgi:hypothetical protein